MLAVLATERQLSGKKIKQDSNNLFSISEVGIANITQSKDGKFRVLILKCVSVKFIVDTGLFFNCSRTKLKQLM